MVIVNIFAVFGALSIGLVGYNTYLGWKTLDVTVTNNVQDDQDQNLTFVYEEYLLRSEYYKNCREDKVSLEHSS